MRSQLAVSYEGLFFITCTTHGRVFGPVIVYVCMYV